MRLLIIILSILISFSAMANDPGALKPVRVQVNAEDIERIEKHLNELTTLVAPFFQEDSEGGRAEGIFYLARPGRLRWDYAPPTPILIVAKGSLVAYYDKELDEVSHISLDDTLAGFLTRSKISFGDEGIKITGFDKQNGEIKIKISQKSKEEEGALTMAFSEDKLDLVRIEVTDAIGKITIVRFKDAIYGGTLDKDMFILPKVKRKLR